MQIISSLTLPVSVLVQTYAASDRFQPKQAPNVFLNRPSVILMPTVTRTFPILKSTMEQNQTWVRTFNTQSAVSRLRSFFIVTWKELTVVVPSDFPLQINPMTNQQPWRSTLKTDVEGVWGRPTNGWRTPTVGSTRKTVKALCRTGGTTEPLWRDGRPWACVLAGGPRRRLLAGDAFSG